MNWSGQKGSDVLTDAYTGCVRFQAVRQCLSVRYTSYEPYMYALPGLLKDYISSCAPGLLTYSICSANMRQKLISSRMQDPQITGTP